MELTAAETALTADHAALWIAPPQDTAEVLLVGDQTALPAVARILEDLAAADRPGLRVTALVEVPTAADCRDLVAPDGAEVVWLVRAGRPHGVALERAVRSWTMVATGPRPALESVAATALPGAYVWVAAEQGVVRAVRRHLLGEAGLGRGQVALMGCWRRGRAQV